MTFVTRTHYDIHKIGTKVENQQPLVVPPWDYTNKAVLFPTTARPPLTGVANTASTAIAATKGGTSFLSLLLAFIAGGFFFSTFMAAVTACYALGMENASLLFRMVRIVLRKVWSSFCVACSLAKEALLPSTTTSTTTTNVTSTAVAAPVETSEESSIATKVKKRWFWKRAYQVFLEELKITRKTAVDGWQAIKMETDFYAAVVGIPGLLPIQYILDHMYPYSIQTMLQDAMRDTVSQMQHKQIKTFELKECDFSNTPPPQLLSFRAYNTGTTNTTPSSADNAMAMDIDMVWKPGKACKTKIDMVVKGTYAKIPVRVTNIQYEGVVRVVAVPLSKTPPGFGALLISLPSLPKVLQMDVTVAGGQITKFPWLRTELMTAVQKSISESLLWPKRIVVPTMIPSSSKNMKRLLPDDELELLEHSDPLLQAELDMRQKQLDKEFGELNPKNTTLSKNATETIQFNLQEDNTNATDTNSTHDGATTMIQLESNPKKQKRLFTFWKRGPFHRHDDNQQKNTTTSEMAAHS